MTLDMRFQQLRGYMELWQEDQGQPDINYPIFRTGSIC